MTHRMALAVIVCCAVFLYPVQAQKASTERCPAVPPENEAQPGRSYVTWVKDSHGEAKAVRVPVKELRVGRLNFAGQTALPVFLLGEIADSLTAGVYDDDEEGLNDIRSRIVDAWQRQGYFKVRVDLPDTRILDESPDSRTIAITATIQAGKQYRVDEIRFADLGQDLASPSAVVVTEGAGLSAAELRALFLAQQGDIFDRHKMQDGMAALRKAYGARGFIDMTAVPSTQIDEKTGRITLVVEIDEGKQFRIGRVEIVGYDRPSVRAFLTSLGIAPGEIFDGSRFDEFEQQVPSAALPDEFRLGAAVRTVNENRGTIDLTLRVDFCPS